MSDNQNAKHPDSNFSAEYPYNQATITRSGHEFHVNDTPGNESLKISHTKGTYVEIDSFGRWNMVVVDKAYSYYKDGFAETVDGHMDVKIHGTLNENVDNSVQRQTKGNCYQGTFLDYNHIVGGSHFTHVKNSQEESVGYSVKHVENDDSLHVSGSQAITIGTAKTESIGSAYSLQSGPGGISLRTQGSFSVITPYGSLSIGPDGIIFTGSSLSLQSQDTVTINALGQVTVNGSIITLN